VEWHISWTGSKQSPKEVDNLRRALTSNRDTGTSSLMRVGGLITHCKGIQIGPPPKEQFGTSPVRT